MSSQNEQNSRSNGARDINLSLGRMIEEGFPDEESLFPNDYANYRNAESNDPDIQQNGIASGEISQAEVRQAESVELMQTSPSNGTRDINLSLGRMIAEGFPDEESLFPNEYAHYRNAESDDPDARQNRTASAEIPEDDGVPETESVESTQSEPSIAAPETVGSPVGPTGYLSLSRLIAEAFLDQDSIFRDESGMYGNDNADVPQSEGRSSEQEPPEAQSGIPNRESNADESFRHDTHDAIPRDGSLSSEERSTNKNVNTNASESEQPELTETSEHPIPFRSLDRMISEVFHEQDSIYREQNQSSESQGSKQAHSESEKSDGQQPVDIDILASDKWPDRNIHEDLSIEDVIHPWGFIDYHLLNRLVEETPVESSVKPGVMVFSVEDYVYFVPYERLRSPPQQGYGRYFRFIFGLIPLPDQNNYFTGKTLVMHWDCKTEEIIARQFSHILNSIHDICNIWHNGVDMYAFKPEDLSAMLVQSVDANDGSMVFPSINGFPWCLDKERRDHPGMQLVILSQAATFMSHMSTVIFSDPNLRAEIINAVRKWRRVLQLSSEAMWTNLRSGCSRAEFIEKMTHNQAVTEALGLNHGKVHEKSWLPVMPEALESALADWNDARKRRQKRLDDEACARAQKRFDEVFGQPLPVSYPRQERTRIPVSQRFNLDQVNEQSVPESISSSLTAKEDEPTPSASPRSSSPESHEARIVAIHRTLGVPRSQPLPIPGRGNRTSIGQKNTHFPGAGSSVAGVVQEGDDNTLVSSSPGSPEAQDSAVHSSLRVRRTRPRQVPNRSDQNSPGLNTHSPNHAESDTAIECEKLPRGQETDKVTESGTTIEMTGTDQNESRNNEQAEAYSSDWPPKIPATKLSSLIDCLQDFVRRHPEVDNVQNRHNFRTMLAYSGIVMREVENQPPKVTRYLLNGEFHTPRD